MSRRSVAGHLRLDADFHDTASDGEDITDDKEDVPAVDELHAVCPAHLTVQSLLKVQHKLLEYTATGRGISKTKLFIDTEKQNIICSILSKLASFHYHA